MLGKVVEQIYLKHAGLDCGFMLINNYYESCDHLNKTDVDGSLAEALTAHIKVILTDDCRRIGWAGEGEGDASVIKLFEGQVKFL